MKPIQGIPFRPPEFASPILRGQPTQGQPSFKDFMLEAIDKVNTMQQDADKAVESLSMAFKKLRTGRAHAGLLEHLTANYYGSEVPLSQAIMLRFIVLCPPARQDDLDDRALNDRESSA